MLLVRLSYQLIYLRATNEMSNGHYSSAVIHLKKAIRLHANDYHCWNKLGEAYYKTGSLQSPKDRFHYTQKSKHAYNNAAKLNALDAEAFYGLARAETRLERLRPLINDVINHYNAIPYFDTAIRLRPNSPTYRYRFIRYLHYTGRKDKCLSVISDLAKINPSIIHTLKQEAFWSVDIKHAVKKGLQQAIKEKTNLESSYFTLSRILLEEKDWDGALFYYKKYLDHIGSQKTLEQYLHVGDLFLKTGEFKKAKHSFLHALTISSHREKTFNKILNIYTQMQYSEALLNFYEEAVANALLPNGSDILFAKALTHLDQYNQAKEVLLRLNKERPSAENYYWLARIAEKQKDWKTMEIAAQKAVSMNEKNSDYHFLFYKILARNQMLREAEGELDLAIKAAENPSYILFIHRASIRSRNHNFRGAAEDWESVIALQPNGARYYAHAANAYKRLGKKRKAIEYYHKAMRLDPKNKNYQKDIGN